MYITKKISAKKYFTLLQKELSKRNDVVVEKYSLKYKAGVFPYWKIKSKNIGPKDKIFLIRAGIHGDEISGPLTILNHINEILNLGNKYGIKFVIYPLGNPSGFSKGKRYNTDNDSGEAGNNDYVRYLLKNDKITDQLKNTNEAKKWYWSSDKTSRLPLENKFFQKLLKQDPLKQIVVSLDLHQDYITKNVPALAYQYSFGNIKKYLPIIKRIKKILPLYKNTAIGAGFNVSLSKRGKIIQPVDKDAAKSDKNGFVIRHDGSLGDLMYWLGVKNNVTTETTGATPIRKAIRVNMLWITGLLDLIIKK